MCSFCSFYAISWCIRCEWFRNGLDGVIQNEIAQIEIRNRRTNWLTEQLKYSRNNRDWREKSETHDETSRASRWWHPFVVIRGNRETVANSRRLMRVHWSKVEAFIFGVKFDVDVGRCAYILILSEWQSGWRDKCN